MESEYEHSGKGELDAGCEEVILPSNAITNGANTSEVGEGAAEYLEEHDPDTQHGDHEEEDAEDAAEQDNEEIEYDEAIEEEELEGEIEAEAEAEAEGEAEADDEELEGEEADEDDADADAEAEELEEEEAEAEITAERKPSQVPKKRRDAAILAETSDGEVAIERKDKNSSKQNSSILSDELHTDDEQPTSTARAAANKENTVEEEQCRVCTAKEDLVSLFKKVENSTVAEMLMTICPKVSIARKDFMPQFICNPCLDNVTVAIQLKTQCETTEHELRKKLSRSKNKVRRPTGFVVIDAPVESDPASEEDEELNDEEFKVSDETGLSMEDDSDDSDFESSKKKVTRGTGGKRGRRKSAAATPGPTAKRMGRPAGKRDYEQLDSDEGDEQPIPIKKKKKTKTPNSDQPQEFPCDECDQVFTRKLSLVLHKKSHGGRQPINCEVCGKTFKIQGAYRTHLERHKDEGHRFECDKCDMVFPSRAEMRYHLADDHKEEGVVFTCEKCKRSFVTEVRLKRHREGHCPGTVMKQKKHEYEYYGGRDLFKTVAPLTTTYWSDSFSD